jgi:hypothetical protein
MDPERRPCADASADPLELRLRTLPQPPVPAGLEARLLARIPTARPGIRPRVAWRAAAAGLTAASLLGVLAWTGAGRHERPSDPPARLDVGGRDSVSPEPDRAQTVAWLEARRTLQGAETPAFRWPLRQVQSLRISSSIPADLLD